MGHKILILQQSEWHRPGKLLLQAATDNNFKLHVTKVWKESATNFEDFDALIILGGPFNIDQDSQYTFLKEEKRLIRAWMNLNKPCLGFNLGQHLLAEAMGATIGFAPAHNKGFTEGHLTHEGRAHPLFQGINTPLTLFKWHIQEVRSPLPRNMTLLATSKDCVAEAFCIEGRSHIIGLQCDNYVGTPEDLLFWCKYNSAMISTGEENLTGKTELFETANVRTREIATTLSRLMRNFVAMFKDNMDS